MKFRELAAHWLCPPGEGVFTVNTGSGKRLALQKALYGEVSPREGWARTLADFKDGQVAIFGIASDCGGGIQRGANWGPLCVREALLQDGKISAVDIGDVRVIPHLLHDKYLNEATLRECRQALYQNAESSWPVSPLSLAEAAMQAFHEDFPKSSVFGIGGDHSTSLPLVRAWANAPSRQGKKLGLLHFDAHTDLLEKRLGIDFCFGTWTFHVREFFPTPDQLIQVGIRSTGKDRGHWEKTLNLTQWWAREVKELGAMGVAEKIVKSYQKAKVEELYLSFDIDALDTQWASATGTPEDQGLDPVECALIIQHVAKSIPITGADLMEVAPMVNANFSSNMGQRLTMETAAQIARLLLRTLGAHA